MLLFKCGELLFSGNTHLSFRDIQTNQCRQLGERSDGAIHLSSIKAELSKLSVVRKHE